MDFKQFLLWERPKHTATEQDAARIARAKARDRLTRSDMPKFSEKDVKGIYNYLADRGQLTAQTFMLWLDFITRKRNRN